MPDNDLKLTVINNPRVVSKPDGSTYLRYDDDQFIQIPPSQLGRLQREINAAAMNTLSHLAANPALGDAVVRKLENTAGKVRNDHGAISLEINAATGEALVGLQVEGQFPIFVRFENDLFRELCVSGLAALRETSN